MKSRIILAGITAVLVAPFAANAADLPPPYKAQPGLVAPVYATWSGFYVGINGGYGFGKSNWDSPAISMDPKGGLAGGTIGYNLQTGHWVWGLEGDIDWSGMSGDAACGIGSCTTKNNWLGTARARIGYAGWNNWLPYITGGAAFGDIKAENPVGGSVSKTQIGWTAGLGVEYAFRSNWSVKVEYLYADLGKFDCGTTCGVTAPDDVSFKANLVRAGVNYRF
ncbi:MAG TPA: outer membrane protein [Pseudolabrys sp.]|nr:outer membrane protein [Pseudolabrys sp.]